MEVGFFLFDIDTYVFVVLHITTSIEKESISPFTAIIIPFNIVFTFLSNLNKLVALTDSSVQRYICQC